MKVSLDKLMTKVDNKYSLVIAASKRARELMSGADPLVEFGVHKPVVVALKEIEEGLIVCDNNYENACVEITDDDDMEPEE